MELEKSYPWIKEFKVSKDHFEKWKSEGAKDCFTSWSLQNNVITQKQYFDWAVEYYKTPFLQDIFFEQNLMTRKEWAKLRGLAHWTARMLPVAVWNDIVFIACLNPKKKGDGKFDFNHRFVLVSSRALETHWKFTRELSRSLDRLENTKSGFMDTRSGFITKSGFVETGHGLEDTKSVITRSNLIDVGAISEDTRSGFITRSNVIDEKLNSTFTSDKVHQPQTKSVTLNKDKKAKIQSVLLDENKKVSSLNRKQAIKIKKTTLLENSETIPSKENLDLKTPKTKEISINNQKIKMESTVPDPEQVDRVSDSKEQTFPGRSNQEINLVSKKVSSSQPSTSLKDKKAGEEKGKKEEKRGDKTLETSGLYMFNQDQSYKNLWEKTNSVFCTSMVLKVKNSQAYLLVQTGRIYVSDFKEEPLIHLGTHSLFKIVNRGHAYHGFIVETEANRKFFDKLGWNNFPKHVTAIPIKDEKDELVKIFLGFAVSSLSKKAIQEIEKNVLDFFSSNKQTHLKVA